MDVGETTINNEKVNIQIDAPELAILGKLLGEGAITAVLTEEERIAAEAMLRQFTDLEPIVGHPPTTKTGRFYEEILPDGTRVRQEEGATKEEQERERERAVLIRRMIEESHRDSVRLFNSDASSSGHRINTPRRVRVRLGSRQDPAAT